MSARRVIDDHLELANIGTNTHAQIDTHIADPSAHHIKYTDAEAVAAADTSNKFIERDTDNIVTGLTRLKMIGMPESQPDTAGGDDIKIYAFGRK